MSVELADDSIRQHLLRSEATVAGKSLSGETVPVMYNPNDPGLESVTLYQSESNPITFKVSNGVAVFPFVMTSSNVIRYELNFRNPDLIYDAEIQIGGAYSEAVRQGNKFGGVIPHTLDVGPVWVTYRKKYDASQPPLPALSEEQLRQTLPEAFRNFEVLNVAKEGDLDSKGQPLPA